MRIALVHGHYDADHLASVTNEMRTLGAPVIDAVWMECYGHWAALEGCHRIRAAKELGLTPEINEIEYSDAQWEDTDYTVADICDGSHESVVINF